MRRQNLSRRELEVGELLSKEKTPSEIAEKLHVSKKTVQFHLENIQEKIGCDQDSVRGWLFSWFS